MGTPGAGLFCSFPRACLTLSFLVLNFNSARFAVVFRVLATPGILSMLLRGVRGQFKGHRFPKMQGTRGLGKRWRWARVGRTLTQASP